MSERGTPDIGSPARPDHGSARSVRPTGVGWPPEVPPRLGGALPHLGGFLVYVVPSSDADRDPVADPHGLRRPSAVGWPRVDSVDRIALDGEASSRPLSGAYATADSADGSAAGADPSDVGRDDTVQDYGRYDESGLSVGGHSAPASVSRETDDGDRTPWRPHEGWATAGSGHYPSASRPRVGSGYVGRAPAPRPAHPDDQRGYPAQPGVMPDGRPEVTHYPAHGSAPAQGHVGFATVPQPASHTAYRDTPTGSPVSSPPEAAGDGYVSRETPSREEEDPPLAMEALRAVQILNPTGEVTMPRPPRTRLICVANQKGGVGKTTTTVNLSVALALHGNRVLVIDLDPQGNASTGLNVPHHAGVPNIYDCLINDVPLADVTQAVEGIPNLWCAPATIDLAGAEIELVSVVARESRLARAIAAYPGELDYVFIDCPPSLGLLTVNALVAAQEVLIPIQCEYYALEGLNQLLNNINLVKQHLNPHLEVSTILLTMYDRRTRLADAVEQDVRNHFGDKVLQAVIPRNVRVSEAPSYGQSVMTYDPASRGAMSYFEAAQELAMRGIPATLGRNA